MLDVSPRKGNEMPTRHFSFIEGVSRPMGFSRNLLGILTLASRLRASDFMVHRFAILCEVGELSLKTGTQWYFVWWGLASPLVSFGSITPLDRVES